MVTKLGLQEFMCFRNDDVALWSGTIGPNEVNLYSYVEKGKCLDSEDRYYDRAYYTFATQDECAQKCLEIGNEVLVGFDRL